MKKTTLLFSFLTLALQFQLLAQNKQELDSLMNTWHQAAAQADAELFFGLMTEEGVYIGTDATERWLRDELKEWSKKAFERSSAWTFTAIERNWHFLSPEVAIGDELLETWMGTCRSTMVLKKVEGQWLIFHYQLSVTVPNERIQEFKTLMESND